MTEKRKEVADNEMLNLWKQFIYEETMSGARRDYRHLDKIIKSGKFIRKFVNCDGNVCVYWIFILCDGEFGYFDGYKYHCEIPISLAKLLDIEKYLYEEEISVGNGNYFINASAPTMN